MKKSIVITITIFALSFSAFAIQNVAQETSQQDSTSVNQETPTSSKAILFVMTAAGVILLGLSFRNSKWGKKK